MSGQPMDARAGAYRLIERLIEEEMGAAVAEHFSSRVNQCVDGVVNRLGLTGPMDVHAALVDGEERGAAILDELLAAILVHETFFYRFASQLDALEHQALPELIARRQSGSLRIWSAGCSRGPEVYTLAMIGERAARRAGKELAVEVLGTDLCNAFLDEARHGAYGEAKLRELPEEHRSLYLRRRDDGTFVVEEAIRKTVRLLRHNLLDPPPGRGFDVVSCRNVLMYLRPAARRTALEHLRDALAPDGVLLVGHSESLRDVADLFAPHRRLALGIYGRAEDETSREDATCREVNIARALVRPATARAGASSAAPRRLPKRASSTKAQVSAPREETEPPSRGAVGVRCSLEGEYDQDRHPERIEQLKASLGDAIDRGVDVVIDADGATSLDRATAVLIARAARAVATKGRRLVVVAARHPVRRWAERHRLPMAAVSNEEGGP